MPYYETFAPVAGVTGSFTRAGHIVGSGCLRLALAAVGLTFSGDVGRRRLVDELDWTVTVPSLGETQELA